jgi:hypothetical protein
MDPIHHEAAHRWIGRSAYGAACFRREGLTDLARPYLDSLQYTATIMIMKIMKSGRTS